MVKGKREKLKFANEGQSIDSEINKGNDRDNNTNVNLITIEKIIVSIIRGRTKKLMVVIIMIIMMIILRLLMAKTMIIVIMEELEAITICQ